MELLRAKSMDASVGLCPPRYPAPPPAYLCGRSPELCPFQSFPFVSQFQAQQPDVGPECLETPEDWVMMYRFKTLPCESQCKRVRECWFYHTNYDCRRVPTFDVESGWFNYFSKKCVVVKWHSGCGYAHNTFELSFHPLLYRTKICKGEKLSGFCSIYGRFCGYAHTTQELRYPCLLYPLQPMADKNSPSASPERSLSPPPGFNQLAEKTPTQFPSCDSTVSPEGLLCLSRTRGALEARLKQIQTLASRRASELRCAWCRHDPRVFLLSLCGHSICYLCGQKGSTECPACGTRDNVLVPLQVD